MSEVEPSTESEAETSDAAGETGKAVAAPSPARGDETVEVIIGEIPDTHDLAHMLWTARCTYPPHGLLGHFATRDEAEQAKVEHLRAEH
jgi:hypothetical protein